MLGRLLVGGARHRPGYLLTVLTAMAAATAALAAAAGLGARLHAALASSDELGVNLLVRPQAGGPAGLPAAEQERLRRLPGIAAVAPWAELGELPLGGRSAALLATTRAALALHRGWALDGRWPGAGEVLAGGASGVALGTLAATPYGVLRVTGLLRTGEALDGALVVDLPSLAAGAATPLLVQRFEVRCDPRRVEAVAAAVMDAVPGAEARPLLRVTTTRARLVARLTWILAAAGALTALLALGTLATASLAQLQARRREIALFFALGYTRSWVARLLALELLATGVLAWMLGSLLGAALAAELGRELLGAAAGGGAWGAAAALVGAVLVLALTVRLTTRRLGTLEPAALLAGR